MRVALIQLNAGADKEHNLRRARSMAAQALANGAQFVLLPEIFHWRGDTRDPAKIAAASEYASGETVRTFAALARQHKAFILIGSIFERTRTGTKPYNTSILINDRGSVAAKYRKIHLFDARIGDKIIRESDCFLAGRGGKSARVGDLTVGLSVCYDVRFADMYRRYARAGADVLTVPSCFTQKTGQAHWEALLRARAIENLCYVLAPNQVGPDAREIEAHGNSMIVSPWGEILARGSRDKEEVIYSEISKAEIVKARAILPGIIK